MNHNHGNHLCTTANIHNTSTNIGTAINEGTTYTTNTHADHYKRNATTHHIKKNDEDTTSKAKAINNNVRCSRSSWRNIASPAGGSPHINHFQSWKMVSSSWLWARFMATRRLGIGSAKLAELLVSQMRPPPKGG